MADNEVARFWDQQAATFDEQPDHGLRDPAVREAWRELLRTVMPSPPARIADLGCGTGSVSTLLAEMGFAVTGLDASAAMLALAAQKAEAAGVDVVFGLGDISDPDLADGSFDALVARHVVWALPRPAEALARWLKLVHAASWLVFIEGQWSTGAGISAEDLTALVEPFATAIEVHALDDETLWGGPTGDTRYLLAART